MDQPSRLLTLEEKISRQKNSHREKPVAIFVDIDDTWEVILKAREKDVKYKTEYFRNKSHEAWQLAMKHHIPIIAVTGRDLDMVLADQRLYIEDPAMPAPFLPFDAVYAGVGTEGYMAQFHDGSLIYTPDSDWDQQLKNRFNRDKVYSVCREVIKEINRLFPPGKNSQPRFVFQVRDSEENVAYWNTHTDDDPSITHYKKPQAHKISLYFTGTGRELATVEQTVNARLAAAGYGKVMAVASYSQAVDPATTIYNIDLLPASKVGAIEYVCGKYSCTALFAGDSGNDYDALVKYGFAVMDPKPELIGKMKDVIVEKTTHFVKVINTATGQMKLIYKDPAPLESTVRPVRGPEVLLDALRAYLLIEDIAGPA